MALQLCIGIKDTYFALYLYIDRVAEYMPFLLRHAGMDADRWKVALNKQLVQLSRPTDAFNKNDNLIEIQGIEKII